MAINSDIKLVPVTDRAKRWLFGLTFVLPVAITVFALAVGLMQHRPPDNLVANSVSLSVLVTLTLVTAISGTLWYFLHRALGRHRIEIDKDSILVSTSFYSQRFKKSELAVESASIVELSGKSPYRPILKTNGFGLPGFTSGWFRLRNKAKAFCAIAESGKAVCIPTSSGYLLLIGLANPESAMQSLKDWAGK